MWTLDWADGAGWLYAYACTADANTNTCSIGATIDID